MTLPAASRPEGPGEGPRGAGPRRSGSRWLGDLVALLLVLPLAATVLAPGYFGGHDDLQPARLFQHHVMVLDGHFPVRWYPDVAGGYGSPEPQFYGPFFFLLAESFLLAGLSLPGSLKAAIVVVLCLTAVATYRLVRAFFGEAGGLVAAAALTYAPYHLLDLFVRATFAELTVFLFLPLMLLALHRLALGATACRVAAAAASVGGLLLSHTVSIMLGPIAVGGWLLLLAWRERFRRDFLVPAAVATALGFALASFFIAPLLADRSAIDIEFYASGYYSYRDHFVAPRQLLYSPWGFGVSVPGDEDGMSFRLGTLQILGCLLAGLIARRIRGAEPGAGTLALFAAALAAVGIFMSMSISSPIWSAFPPFRFLGLPLRLLLGPAFGMSILCGAALGTLLRRARFRTLATAALCASFAVFSIPMIGFQDRAPLREFRYRTDAVGRPLEGSARPGRDRLVFTREFVREQFLYWSDRMPKGWWPYPAEEDLARPRAEVARGQADIRMIEERPSRYRMEVRASRPSLLRLNVYRFPGWEIRLDGRPVEWGPLPGRRPVLSVEVPEGVHEVEASIRRTPSRWFGDTTSLAAVLLVGVLSAGCMRRRRHGGTG